MNDCRFHYPSPDLEILLEVNLNFQVRLTVIMACGIFSRENGSGSSMLKYNHINPFLSVIFVQLDKGIIFKCLPVIFNLFTKILGVF